MLELVKTHLKKEPYTNDDVKAVLGCTILDLVNDIQNHDIVLSSNTEYYLFK